jgi:uncharacterized protein YndB with AHSA1/START domain
MKTTARGETADRIERKVVLHAPLARVWRALTDTREFGQWFGVELEGPFLEGESVAATFTHEIDKAALGEYQRKLGLAPSKIRQPEGRLTFCTVERIEPERYFSFRWIPYGIDAEADPANEPQTLVEFRLEPTAEGTLLTIVESGFDRVPPHRRERAFRMNEGGWSAQAENVKKYVERA